MLRYTLTLFPLILLAILLQQYLPAFMGIYNARVFLLLATFLCISVTVPLPIMFLLALSCGFLWDAQCYVGNDNIDPSVAREAVQGMRFGSSILLFGLAGSLMHGFRQLFLQRKWLLICILAGICTYIYMISEYAIIDFMRGSFTINKGVMLQIAYTSLFSTIVSPIVFAALLGIAHIFDHTIVDSPRRSASRWGI